MKRLTQEEQAVIRIALIQRIQAAEDGEQTPYSAEEMGRILNMLHKHNEILLVDPVEW